MIFIKIVKKLNRIISFILPKNKRFFYIDDKNKLKKLYLTNEIYFDKNTDNCKIDLEIIKEKNLKKYNLIILGEEINNYNNKKIQKIINFFLKNNKNIIIEGYSSFYNLNIDNFCNWFRPIDVTKDPFNYKNTKILYKNISFKFLIQYLILIFLIIYINIKNNSFLNFILFASTLIIIVLIPFKKILQIRKL